MEEIKKEETKKETGKKAAANFSGVGRRKTSIAKVIIKEGTPSIIVNGIELNKYFPRITHQITIKSPLEVLGLLDKYTVRAMVSGGGLSSQAGAIRLGISRALLNLNPEFRVLLAKDNLLTRDPRMVERKKYGRAGARKRFQFSKR